MKTLTILLVAAMLVATPYVVSAQAPKTVESVTVGFFQQTTAVYQAGFMTGVVLTLPEMPCYMSGSILQAMFRSLIQSGEIKPADPLMAAIARTLDKAGCLKDSATSSRSRTRL